MTTGTKIFLAVFALIVGILVVYYGLVVPERGSTTTTTSEAEGEVANAEGDQSNLTANANSQATDHAALSRADENAGATGGQDRDAPPPRQPGPTSPIVNVQPPSSAGPAGGLLSEGLREVTGESGDAGAVQPLGDAASPPNPFLPLIGINAGGAQPAGDAPKDDVQAPAAPQDVTRPLAATQPASARSTPTDAGATSVQAPPRAPANNPNRAQPRVEYIISEGDTYSSIAEEWFGDKTRWNLIAKENPTIDPMRLKIGQRIYLPPKDVAAAQAATAAAEPVPVEGELIYTVQSGDTLSSIARDHFGDSSKWRDIYDRNRETIGSDAGALKVGMKLRLMMKR